MNFDYILKKLQHRGLDGCAALLDIKSAYDQVDHGLLWSTLYNQGICGNLLEVIKLLFNDSQLHVGLSGFVSEVFSPKVGLLQGSVLSPLLFNIYIDSLLPRLCLEGGGLEIPGAGHINALLFTDDVALLTESTAAMRRLLRVADEHAGRLRLMWNVSKSVILANQHVNRLVRSFQISAQPIPVAPVAKYLGIAMNSDGIDIVQHVRNLAAKGWAAYGQLHRCRMHR